VVVLQGENYPEAYLLDLATGMKTRLPRKEQESLDSFSVSPNRQLLIYQAVPGPGGTPRFLITNSDGQPRNIIPNKENWFTVADWLDNDRLFFSPRPGESQIDPVPLILLNTKTDDKLVLQPDYPNINLPIFGYMNWEGYVHSATVYDSSLRLVVYPRTVKGIGAIVLWDVKDKKEIVSLTGMNWYSRTPKWSPDGSSFVINSTLSVSDPYHKSPNPDMIGKDQELFRISREGQVYRLTDFMSIYETSQIGYSSWSPDGRYVAFWVDAEPNDYVSGESLAVWDSQTNQVTNYCVPGIGNGLTPSPIWSQDSNLILVEGYDYKENNNRVFIVDIVKGFAALNIDNLAPVGWMVNTP
jgi:hypothetical protein